MSKKRPFDFTQALPIEPWFKACGYEIYADAAKALDVSLRTIMRWKVQGIPKGGQGRRIAKQMALILSRRQK